MISMACGRRSETSFRFAGEFFRFASEISCFASEIFASQAKSFGIDFDDRDFAAKGFRASPRTEGGVPVGFRYGIQ
jgi:hypothetical protein